MSAIPGPGEMEDAEAIAVISEPELDRDGCDDVIVTEIRSTSFAAR